MLLARLKTMRSFRLVQDGQDAVPPWCIEVLVSWAAAVVQVSVLQNCHMLMHFRHLLLGSTVSLVGP